MPVHIRNLSASGALVEGHALPDAGTAVSIRRAKLEVGGIVAWKSANQAGIAFHRAIFVPSWLPGTSASRQCAIDSFVFDSKAGPRGGTRQPETPDPPAGAVPAAPGAAAQALAELAALKTELIALGEALCGDVILVATHPEIQAIDIAIQRVDRLLALARAPGAAPGQRMA